MPIIMPILQQLQAALPANSLRRRLASGAFWMLVGSAIAQAIGLVGTILVARILGKTVFGKLGIVTSTIAMFGVVAELSVGLTANKHIAALRKNDPQRAGRILGLATVAALVSGCFTSLTLFLLADVLATHALGDPSVAPLLKLSAPLLAFTALSGLQSGALSGFEAFRQMTQWRFVTSVLGAVLGIAGVLTAGINGVIIANVISAAISFGVFRQVLLRLCGQGGIRICYTGVWVERNVLFMFALPAVFSSLMATPAVWAANAILVKSSGGFAALGAFNAASQWRSLLLFVPVILSEVTLPMLSSLLSEGRMDQFVRTLKFNAAANVAVGLALAAPISCLSYWIMGLYGPGFKDHWPVLVFLALATVMQAANAVIGQAIASLGRMWQGAALNILWACELLLSTKLLLPLGATGLALAYLIAYALHTAQVGAYTVFVLRSMTVHTPPKSSEVLEHETETPAPVLVPGNRPEA